MVALTETICQAVETVDAFGPGSTRIISSAWARWREA